MVVPAIVSRLGSMLEVVIEWWSTAAGDVTLDIHRPWRQWVGAIGICHVVYVVHGAHRGHIAISARIDYSGNRKTLNSQLGEPYRQNVAEYLLDVSA
jgi:hypothetical protein